MESSSRFRSGTFDRISILPPRCMRNVRSLTLWILTPSIFSMTPTISSACSVSRVATVTSMRILSWPAVVTSSAVTIAPVCSTTWVIWLTAMPPAGASSRIVIEYDTLGTLVMLALPFGHVGRRDYRPLGRCPQPRAATWPLSSHRLCGGNDEVDADALGELRAVQHKV